MVELGAGVALDHQVVVVAMVTNTATETRAERESDVQNERYPVVPGRAVARGESIHRTHAMVGFSGLGGVPLSVSFSNCSAVHTSCRQGGGEEEIVLS